MSYVYTEFFNHDYGTVRSLPVIAIGASIMAHGTIRFLIIDDDGKMQDCDATDFVADLRYRDGSWHDVSPGSMQSDDDEET